MKQIVEFVKTTVVGGLVVILPLAAAMLLTTKSSVTRWGAGSKDLAAAMAR